MANPMAEGSLTSLRHFLDRGDTWVQHNLAAPISSVPVLNHTSARGLLIGAVALILLTTLPALAERTLKARGCVALNFRGDRIPQAFGLVVLACGAILLLLDAAVSSEMASDRILWLTCLVAFGSLGLLDDVVGEQKVKGLRGHLSALIRNRKVTTGLIKLLGGVAAAFAIGWWLHPGRPLLVLLSAMTIALGANALNLLDLRPGRACAAFCVGATVALLYYWRYDGVRPVPSLLYVVLPAFAVWPRDSQARVMLGDTGSNLLGAALGLAVSSYFEVPAQLVVLATLILLHIAAERVSLSKVIEASPILSKIDKLTGVR